MVGGAYGQAAEPVGADVADSGVVIAPGNMELAPVDMDAATDVAAALKQLTGLWWWLTELSGFTLHGNVLVPNGLGTLDAQLLYDE